MFFPADRGKERAKRSLAYAARDYIEKLRYCDFCISMTFLNAAAWIIIDRAL